LTGSRRRKPLDRLRAARLEIRHQRGDEKVEKATLRDMRPAEPLGHGARPHQLGWLIFVGTCGSIGTPQQR